MDGLKRINLRIVSVDRVHSHEIADPGREQRIERRLRQDGVLRDPLLVGAVPDVDGYILLDGTNRLGSLRHLELPLALVQIVDYANPHDIELQTWCHRPPITLDHLVSLAASIQGLAIAEIPPLGTVDALREPRTVAVALDHGRRIAFTGEADHYRSRVAYLCELIDLYEDVLVRTDCDIEDLEEIVQTADAANHEPAALIAFPPLTRSQVVSLALSGTRIPAGITRHVIRSGRALRVNVPLELLSGNEQAAQSALEWHLAGLHPRLYQEPTILYDS
ncbi:MAG TPA: hypothetical protein VF898_13895 [Chloroflexota bacterium]